MSSFIHASLYSVLVLSIHEKKEIPFSHICTFVAQSQQWQFRLLLFRTQISCERIDFSIFCHLVYFAYDSNAIPSITTGNPFTRSIHAMENIESSTARYTIPHLRELFITHTNLTNISSSDFDGYNELQHLHLLQNRIHKIAPYTFKHLNSLLSLDISVNNLETFPSDCFNGLVQLRRFNLSTNRLGSLDELPNTVGYLESLDVSYNHIGYIARAAFQHLRELTELRLAGNRITGLSADTIRPLNNLILLDLRENLFRQIPLEALELVETHLKTVQIECKCEILLLFL